MPQRRLFIGLIAILTLLISASAPVLTGSTAGGVYSLSTALRGDNENPPGDSDGFGFAKITVFPDTGEICFSLSVARVDPLTSAHIHRGSLNEAEPVVVDLDGVGSDGLTRGCKSVDLAILREILVTPGDFYVNVHNAEYPDGALRGQLAIDGAARPLPPETPVPDLELVASGLESPRGIAFGPDNSLFVVEAGVAGDDCVEVPEPPAFGDPILCFGATGAVTMVADGVQERVVTGLPSHRTGGQITGVQDIAIDDDGQIFLTIGYAQDPAYRDDLVDMATLMGQLVSVDQDGTVSPVADLAMHELSSNPEPTGGDHSNPFGVVIQDNGFIIVDSAGNDLLHVAEDGSISTIATFPPQMVEVPAGSDGEPATIVPMASVPTSVAIGPDGAYYVGEFSGYPFVPDTSRIWRVVPGQAPEVFATGFTAVIDLAFDEGGRLYVLEAVQGGLGAIDRTNPSTLAGALIRLDADGTRTTLLNAGLLFPTSVVVGPDDMVYVTNNGIVPGQGQVVRFQP